MKKLCSSCSSKNCEIPNSTQSNREKLRKTKKFTIKSINRLKTTNTFYCNLKNKLTCSNFSGYCENLRKNNEICCKIDHTLAYKINKIHLNGGEFDSKNIFKAFSRSNIVAL